MSGGMRFKFRRRIWRLVWWAKDKPMPKVSPDDESPPSDRMDLGRCESPESVDKRILVRKGQEGRQLLDTFIHEALHAAHWDMDEEAVGETAHDIARMLWRLGYRRTTED